jgi:uncharacterized protein YukE
LSIDAQKSDPIKEIRRNEVGIADDVKNLADDIVASYNARIKAIEAIAKETRVLANNTHGMLKRFHAEHQGMSAGQAKALAGFTADMTKNVAGMLKGFSAEHEDMAAALKSNLKKNTKDIETYVKNKLREFSGSHAEMSAELKKDLEKYVADIVKGTRELLDGFHDEREQMAAGWQAMAAVMAKKKGVAPVGRVAGAEAKTVEKAVEKPKKGKPGRKPAKKN